MKYTENERALVDCIKSLQLSVLDEHKSQAIIFAVQQRKVMDWKERQVGAGRAGVNMTEVEMGILIAELEGVDVEVKEARLYEMNMDGGEWLPCAYYEPVSNDGINHALARKYSVSINFYDGIVSILADVIYQAAFRSGIGLNYAIVECILKSVDKWE